MSHNTTNEMWSPTADTAEADILLLGDPGVVEPLRTRLGRRKTVAVGDPYDAILALHEKPHRCVVVSAPQPEFPGLCRALRRVHAHGPLMAVGTTATEPAMRSLTPSVLDDYFISPPTPADVERIRAADRSMGVPPMRRTGFQPVLVGPERECFAGRHRLHGRDAHATHGRDARATFHIHTFTPASDVCCVTADRSASSSPS